MDEGYFIEACRACHGYLKGVDRRQRWNAGSPLVEDWGSPHLDLHAAREGYWRSTPSLAHLLPPRGGPGRGPRVNAVLYDVALTAYILAAAAAIGLARRPPRSARVGSPCC